METQTCPNCGHENLARAVFCFQCGTRLEDPPIVRGLHHGQRRVEDAMRYLQGREDALSPEVLQNLREVRAVSPPMDGEPILLRCGTLTSPGELCVGCGTALTLPKILTPLRSGWWRAAAHSDVGRMRENNEDRVGLWGVAAWCWRWADGMGAQRRAKKRAAWRWKPSRPILWQLRGGKIWTPAG